MTTSSAEVLRVAGRPDHGAAGARLSALFARHGAAVLGLCRVLMRNREEAEDAVQQTFLAAYRSLLNGTEPRHPAAWLATIARNECWGRIEQRMREPLTEHELESTLPDPVVAAADKADLTELWRAIGELPRQQRSALLLREFSGLSYAELAAALDVSEPAVESLLFRARRELRARLSTVYGSVGSVAPLAAIREALSKAIGGMPDPGTTGALAKVASAPLMAKVVAGAAGVMVAGGTVVAVESHSTRHRTPVRDAQAAVVHPAARPAAPVARVSAVKPTVAGRARPVHPSSLPFRATSRPTATQALAKPTVNPVRPDPTAAPPAPAATPAARPSTPVSAPAAPSPSDGQGAPAGGDVTAGGANEPDGSASPSGSDGQGENSGSNSSPGGSGDENVGSSGEGDTSGGSGDESGSSGGSSAPADGQGSDSGSGSGKDSIGGDAQDGGTGGHGKG